MTISATKRLRRKPEQAREKILDAAEHILLETGPPDLKFERLSRQVGISQSTIHHHFGSIAAIQEALVRRMIDQLTSDLKDALEDAANQSAGQPDDLRATNILRNAYMVTASASHTRLIAWLVLTAGQDHLAGLVQPLAMIESMAANLLARHVPVPEAQRMATSIIYRSTITALGDGLIGGTLKQVLGPCPDCDEIVASLMHDLPYEPVL